MRLYLKECRKIATSIVYYFFIVLLIVNWYQNFAGVTQEEIEWAKGGSAPSFIFDRPLLKEPSPEDEFFGSKTVENPEKIMQGATDSLLMEYENNLYATYPFGYYKAVSLDAEKQARILEILCEITGLTEEQLENLPDDYFPAVNGTIIHFGAITADESSEGFSIPMGDDTGTDDESDFTKKFISQVSYEQFLVLMTEVESLIGEAGSRYSKEMMITYFGITDMTYEEALSDYQQTIDNDEVTGGFARLFCDYIGQVLGLYPVFLIVVIWLKDRYSKMNELIDYRQVSSVKLVLSRYFASVTMILLPVVLLSFQSLLPLMGYAEEQGLAVDYFAFIKYIMWWLVPTVIIVTALGTCVTLLTDTPVAILLQFAWWFIDRGITGLSGDTHLFTLMVRHNTLRGFEIIQQDISAIWANRLCLVCLSGVLLLLSIWLIVQKRKGRINAAAMYEKWFCFVKGKLGAGHQV